MAVILITGASTGVGLSTAITLAQAGHKIYATLRNTEQSPDLARAVTDKKLGITILIMDIDNNKSVARTFGFVLRKEGRVDILVNASLESLDVVPTSNGDAYEDRMEFALLNAFRCIREVLPHMKERRRGYIMDITSLSILAHDFHSQLKKESLSECLASALSECNIKVAKIQSCVLNAPIPTSNGESIVTKIQVPFDVMARKIQKLIEMEDYDLNHLPLTNEPLSFEDEEWLRIDLHNEEKWYNWPGTDIAKRVYGNLSSK